jgi:hypothetical protein
MNNSIKLPLIVALCHLPILFIHINSKPKPQEKKKKIVINTIKILDEKPLIAYNIESSRPPAAKPKRTSNPKPKPKKKPKVVTKKIAKKAPKKTPKKKISKKKIQKALNKSLAKSKVVSKKGVKKAAPSKKVTKKDAGKDQSEYNLFLSDVFNLLAESLELPEKGKVKLSITVRSNGSVAKLVSISSESDENLDYLLSNLKSLSFPTYTKKEDRTFTIVFSDEK